jgi:hypothetical protein
VEETISTTFTKSANLQALMLKECCPPAIKNCSGHFSKFVDPQVRNTLLTDIAHFLAEEEAYEPRDNVKGKMTAIPAGLHKALKTHFQGSSSMPREAKVLSSYMLNGLTFSTFTRHRGNSFILVRRPSLPSVPAQIESMLQTPSNDTFFVARYFLKPLSNDPFKKYPLLQSSLWSQELGQLVIVNPKDVESHFACLAFKWNGTDSFAVVSLSRVFACFCICPNQCLPPSSAGMLIMVLDCFCFFVLIIFCHIF